MHQMYYLENLLELEIALYQLLQVTGTRKRVPSIICIAYYLFLNHILNLFYSILILFKTSRALSETTPYMYTEHLKQTLRFHMVQDLF